MAFMLCESSDAGQIQADPYLGFFRWNTSVERWSNEAIDSVQRLEYYLPTEWEICDENNAKIFSAIGYHFGKMLRDSLKVPVGIICNAVGERLGRISLHEEYGFEVIIDTDGMTPHYIRYAWNPSRVPTL